MYNFTSSISKRLNELKSKCVQKICTFIQLNVIFFFIIFASCKSVNSIYLSVHYFGVHYLTQKVDYLNQTVITLNKV